MARFRIGSFTGFEILHSGLRFWAMQVGRSQGSPPNANVDCRCEALDKDSLLTSAVG